MKAVPAEEVAHLIVRLQRAEARVAELEGNGPITYEWGVAYFGDLGAVGEWRDEEQKARDAVEVALGDLLVRRKSRVIYEGEWEIVKDGE